MAMRRITFVPGPSRHPVMASIGLFFYPGRRPVGERFNLGAYSLAFGLVWWLVVLYQWFRDSVAESEGGLYGHKIDLSYRWSMSWFIFFSEVMFSVRFSPPSGGRGRIRCQLLGSLENALIWPNFQAVWPSAMAGATASPAGIVEPFQTVGPFWLPTINTALLLTSGSH